MGAEVARVLVGEESVVKAAMSAFACCHDAASEYCADMGAMMKGVGGMGPAYVRMCVEYGTTRESAKMTGLDRSRSGMSVVYAARVCCTCLSTSRGV